MNKLLYLTTNAIFVRMFLQKKIHKDHAQHAGEIYANKIVNLDLKKGNAINAGKNNF
jgi:hypothetical protein